MEPSGLLFLFAGLVLLLFILHYLVWKDADPCLLRPSHFEWNPTEQAHHDIPTTEKIAVVGAGFCGLGTAAALKRHGIPFEVFEMDSDIGGNWKHGVYETVHIISSRRTTEYKDWPMPSNWPDFPSAQQVLSYLAGYVDYYSLRPHIRFNCQVARVQPIGKGSDSKGWQIELSDGTKQVFKGVVIANGHHWAKRLPSYEGMSAFTGESIHSKDYKSPSQLKGKRVLVVGGGNSACDIAVEASRFGETSHVSHRRGYWFLPRSIMGIPIVDIIRPWFPLWFQRWLIYGFLHLTVGPYERYGLQKPDHAVFEHHPTINSELLHYIKLGRITPHPDIARMEEKTVHFVDGSKEEVDLIVYATGFNIELPMLDKELLEFKDGVPQLVADLYVENYKHLYVLGIGQPRYGAGPLITAAADHLARAIKVQDELKHPISALVQAIGIAKKPKKSAKFAEVVLDPYVTFLEIQGGNWLLPKLPFLERVLTKIHLLK